jgi:hypothetical protein
MTNKHWLMLVLFIVPFPLGEIYRLFDDKTIIIPWLSKSYRYPVTMRYYVDVLMDRLIDVIYTWLILMCVEIKRLKLLNVAATVTLVYVVFDFVMYLVNHNDYEPYIFMYSCLGGISLLVYWIRKEMRKLRELYDRTKHQIEAKEIYQ